MDGLREGGRDGRTARLGRHCMEGRREQERNKMDVWRDGLREGRTRRTDTKSTGAYWMDGSGI